MDYDRTSLPHKLKIIEGQIKGLAKMIDENQYCIDILTQSLSIQKSLQKIDTEVLKDHIKCCVVDQMKNGEEQKSIEELVKIYSLRKKT